MECWVFEIGILGLLPLLFIIEFIDGLKVLLVLLFVGIELDIEVNGKGSACSLGLMWRKLLEEKESDTD